MVYEAFFVDKEGKKISMDKISSHIGLAIEIMKNDAKLYEEFKKSRKRDPVDFLISDKGYIKITKQGYYRKCIYSSSKISEIQKYICLHYIEQGYSVEDQDRLNMMGIGRE